MATQNVEAHCSICKEETNTFTCPGCSKEFGFEHLREHRQSLNTQLQHVQNDYDQFRQTLNVLEQDLEKHALFEKINQWRKDSIEKIEETARECRENLIKYLNPIINELKTILDDPKGQPKSMEKGNELNEIDLDKFTEKLKKLKEELDQPSTISIEQKATPFIRKIDVRSGKFFSQI
jgi:DNA repair exonuclease SbcCD ATPase subunit